MDIGAPIQPIGGTSKMSVNVEIVSIGSELLLGQIVDTNSAWISQRLAENGANVFYKSCVGDNQNRMTEVLRIALNRADVVITGGGIGPTQDDLTREAVAEVFGVDVVTDPDSLTELHERFQNRGFILTKNNERQAQIPEGAKVIRNPNGTAPAFMVESEKGTIISLPGVPFEMKWLITNEIIPYLRKKYDLGETIHYRVLKVADLGESAVDHEIGHLIAESSNPTVGVLARPGQVDVRIAARAATVEAANSLIEPVEAEVRKLLGNHIFGTDEETIESVIGDMLRQHDATVAVYEDLSGGAVSDSMRTSAGDRFLEAIVANTDIPRDRLIGNSSTEELTGEERAIALANAIREHSGASLGIAVHGIPESEGSAENLARGDTYIVICDANKTEMRHVRSAGSGAPDRRRAAMYTFGALRQHLLKSRS
ncbi:MAG: CinA family nicotinamide mononucleotide deamidase-related protein [Chloroflexi bacterium]|nr:CinA family nicotinamide mononucleotide deamidase-related protein [Chloroflexota bacterium]